MTQIKTFELPFSVQGKDTIYGIVKQRSTGFFLDSTTGDFWTAPPNIFNYATEDPILKGLYVLSENRNPWSDGDYFCVFYDRQGASEDPSVDTVLGSAMLSLMGDVEVVSRAPQAKVFELPYSYQNKTTVYGIIKQRSTDLLLDSTTGDFLANPVNEFNYATEDPVLKGLYSISENRTFWSDGEYLCVFYERQGATENPDVDLVIGTASISLVGDVPGENFHIIHRDINGQWGIKAHVQRLDDLLYWNETIQTWVTSESAQCDIPLTEGTTQGKYEGGGRFKPSTGTTYETSIFTSSGLLIVRSRQPYTGDTKTALILVNDIQAALRLPQNDDLTAPHAKLILAQLNKAVQFMMEKCEWPEMNLSGTFATKVGVNTYAIRPISSSRVDTIKRLQIEDHTTLNKRTDHEFRHLQKRNTTQQEPTDYRIAFRAAGTIVIEVTPTPDAIYEVDFDLLLQPEPLVNAADIPLLNSDVVYLGGYAFARKEQGESYQDDLAAFNAKMTMQEENQTEPNWGDARPI